MAKKTKLQKMKEAAKKGYERGKAMRKIMTMSVKGRDIPLPTTHTKAMKGKKTASKNNPKPGPYEY